jgi:hypothetical protein
LTISLKRIQFLIVLKSVFRIIIFVAAIGCFGSFLSLKQEDKEPPIIRYVVRPDPKRATVDVRATIRIDDHKPYLLDFGQLAAIRWYVDGKEVEVKSERIRDRLIFSGLPQSGEAEAVYSLNVITKAEPGYRKRLMGGPGYLMAREGLFLGKDRKETMPVDVVWDLPPDWTLVLVSPGIQRFDQTQKRLWIAGKTLESFEEVIEGRVLRGAILAGVTKISGDTLRRTLTAVFKSSLERFGPARLSISGSIEKEGGKPDLAGPGETFGIVVFPDGTIGGGTALGFDLASEENLPTIVHEMLHWWSNPNAPVWFREGVHSYISVKLMAKLGLITTEEFLEAMRGFIKEHARVVKREGGLSTLEQSAKSYDQRKGGGDMYGAMPLLAFKLDREIRTSNPKADLDLVFAEVCRSRPASIDISTLIKLRTGYDLEPLFRKYFYAPIVDAEDLLR